VPQPDVRHGPRRIRRGRAAGISQARTLTLHINPAPNSAPGGVVEQPSITQALILALHQECCLLQEEEEEEEEETSLIKDPKMEF
jgi:hypothetical protein